MRPSKTASFVAAGPDLAQGERAWAEEMADFIIELVGKEATLGLERMNAGVAIAFGALGFRVVDAQQAVEMARSIKSAEELKAMISENAGHVVFAITDTLDGYAANVRGAKPHPRFELSDCRIAEKGWFA